MVNIWWLVTLYIYSCTYIKCGIQLICVIQVKELHQV